MKTKITDLREHLFATLEGLLDEEKPMDLERAQAVANVGKVNIESAKVEVDMFRALDQAGQMNLNAPKFFEPKQLS